MFSDLLELSLKFEKIARSGFIKEATISSDLAVRMMHSLVPLATEDPEDAKNAQVQLTIKHLLAVAERYMQRAAKIVVEELLFSSNQEAYKKATIAFKNNMYLSVAKIGKNEFERDNFESFFGGPRWLQFSEGLIKLGTAIKKFRYDLSKNNTDEIIKGSGLISAYMNYLDGLTHNTGSFLDKMLRNEAKEQSLTGEDFRDIYLKNKQEALSLMDAKQLSHKEDVLSIIKDQIYGNPDAYLYREYFTKLNKEKTDPQRTETELFKIRQKKDIMSHIDKCIDSLILDMKKAYSANNFSEINNFFRIMSAIPMDDIFVQFSKELKYIIKKYEFNKYIGLKNTTNIEQGLKNHFESVNYDLFDFVAIVESQPYHILCDKYSGDCEVEKISPMELVTEYSDKEKIYIDKDQLFDIDDANISLKDFLENIIKCMIEMRNFIVAKMNLPMPELK